MILQNKLGIAGCPAFDIQAVCSGFVYALATADNFIKAGAAKCALVIGAETFSRIVDWTDRGNCILWGDGAGAVILQAQLKSKALFLHICMLMVIMKKCCTCRAKTNGTQKPS